MWIIVNKETSEARAVIPQPAEAGEGGIGVQMSVPPPEVSLEENEVLINSAYEYYDGDEECIKPLPPKPPPLAVQLDELREAVAAQLAALEARVSALEAAGSEVAEP